MSGGRKRRGRGEEEGRAVRRTGLANWGGPLCTSTGDCSQLLGSLGVVLEAERCARKREAQRRLSAPCEQVVLFV